MKRPRFVSVLVFLDFLLALILLFAAVSSFIFFYDANGQFLGAVLLPLAILHILAGLNLRKLRPGGRSLQLLVSGLWIIVFPIGTPLGIYSLYYLMKRSVKSIFLKKPAQEYSAAEIEDFRIADSRIHLWALAGIFLFAILAAAIVVPNLMNIGSLRSGSRQKRTMAEIRSIAVAAEAYAVDNNSYPAAATLNDLAGLFEPTYMKTLPRKDGWGHEFRYEAWDTDPKLAGLDEYAVASPGKDGLWEYPDLQDYTNRSTQKYEADIVWRNGMFLQFPEGIRQ